MLPMDPRQMQAIMRQMGVKSRIVDAKRVVIECGDTSIVIDNPQVVEMEVKGEKSYNVTGKVREETVLNEEDIRLVMESTGATREEAIAALKKEGDVASAIVFLKENPKK